MPPRHSTTQPVTNSSIDDEIYMDTKSASKFLGGLWAPRTLEGLRFRGGGPKYVSLSRRRVCYRKSDLIEFVESRVRTKTSKKKSTN